MSELRQSDEVVDMSVARLRRAEQRVHDRIDNLLATADRFDHERGSKALARRMRDKASGMEAALRLLNVPAADDKALAESAAWIAESVGYPVETKMPERQMPQALWDALVDHIHADPSGNWHGNTLDREEAESWLADEAGRVITTPTPSPDDLPCVAGEGGGSDVSALAVDLHEVLHEVWLRIHVRRFDEYEPDTFYAGVTKAERIVAEIAREHGIDRVYDLPTHTGGDA